MSEATVIALGFFDGVHLGHGALLRKTAERARELGLYIQKYCGCVFSEEERYLKPSKRIP